MQIHKEEPEPTIPNTVLGLVIDNDWTTVKAWRVYLQLTPEEIAKRMNVSYSAYVQYETTTNLTKAMQHKIAVALDIHPIQIAF